MAVAHVLPEATAGHVEKKLLILVSSSFVHSCNSNYKLYTLACFFFQFRFFAVNAGTSSAIKVGQSVFVHSSACPMCLIQVLPSSTRTTQQGQVEELLHS